jgi:proline dehydrogenase
MARYNTSRAVVHTTVQLYRHDRPAYTQALFERAKAGGWIAGVKLVRGAYIEKETLRAREKGYPNPLFPNKLAVDAAFDDTARFCLERLEQFSIFAGTHHEASCRKIADWLVQNGLDTRHPHVYFSQLYGMSDNLSFNLAGAGFNVAKYLPYGPLEEVLPYLFRRAQENSSIQGQSSRELTLLQREHKRRKCSRRKA